MFNRSNDLPINGAYWFHLCAHYLEQWSGMDEIVYDIDSYGYRRYEWDGEYHNPYDIPINEWGYVYHGPCPPNVLEQEDLLLIV